MKKIILAILLIVIFIIGIAFHRHSSISIDSTNSSGTNLNSAGHPDPSNATFDLDDRPVTLTNGKAVTSSSESAASSETDLTDTIGYGDLNNDGKEDSAFVLIEQGSGTGTFLYLAAYVSGNVSYKGSNAIFLGDRINPQAISIKNGIISVTYLDRRPDEPMTAEPSVPTTKTFAYLGGQLVAR